VLRPGSTEIIRVQEQNRALNETPNASREQIMEALEGHICRCTGYVKIIAAIESVANGAAGAAANGGSR